MFAFVVSAMQNQDGIWPASTWLWLDGKYSYTDSILGYDESLVTADGDWTEGFYDATSGTFYVDNATTVVIDTEEYAGNYGIPAAGKTATEWLDDFFARREYWMILELEVQGNHVNVIHDIYSYD